MKHLLLIFIALLFCQCTNKKNDALLEIKEMRVCHKSMTHPFSIY